MTPTTTIRLFTEEYEEATKNPPTLNDILVAHGKPPTAEFTQDGRRFTWDNALTGSSSEDTPPDIDFTTYNKKQLRAYIFTQTSIRPPLYKTKDQLIALAVQINTPN